MISDLPSPLHSVSRRAAVEGWIIFVTGIHEEAQEDDVLDRFAEYGEVKNIALNLERQTGLVKGYALLEYTHRKEAEEAINSMNGQDLLGQPLTVDWAFVQDEKGSSSGTGGPRGGGDRRRR